MKFSLKLKGFTLTELIAVILIVGLLAAVAVPIYKVYTGRAKMDQAVTIIQRPLDIWSEQNVLGNTPSNTLTSPSPGVASITLSSSGVTATLNSAYLTFLPSNVVLTYTPTVGTNGTTWAATYPPGTPTMANYFPPNITCSSCS